MTVALCFRPKGTNHLGMAHHAGFTDIDITSGKLQGRVGLQAIHRFRHGRHEKQRHDLNQAANQHDAEDQHDHQANVFFNFFVSACHDLSSVRGGRSRY